MSQPQIVIDPDEAKESKKISYCVIYIIARLDIILILNP